MPSETEAAIENIVALAREKQRHRKVESGAQEADDWLAAFAKKSDEALAKRAAEQKTTPPPNEKALVEALARKDHTEYDRMRVEVAETLGIRVGTLDDKVEAVRKKSSDQGSVIAVEDLEPWAEPIDGAALLHDMSIAVTAHIAMKETEADTIALWCVYSHAFDLFAVAPRLGIRAATAECGKTETLRRIRRFVNRPLECDGLTAAVFFRVIDASHPTFLLDELDNMLPEDKAPCWAQ
jgi:putative DNA primase/helicase